MFVDYFHIIHKSENIQFSLAEYFWKNYHFI